MQRRTFLQQTTNTAALVGLGIFPATEQVPQQQLDVVSMTLGTASGGLATVKYGTGEPFVKIARLPASSEEVEAFLADIAAAMSR